MFRVRNRQDTSVSYQLYTHVRFAFVSGPTHRITFVGVPLRRIRVSTRLSAPQRSLGPCDGQQQRENCRTTKGDSTHLNTIALCNDELRNTLSRRHSSYHDCLLLFCSVTYNAIGLLQCDYAWLTTMGLQRYTRLLDSAPVLLYFYLFLVIFTYLYIFLTLKYIIV